MTGRRAGGVGVRSARIVAHSTLTGLMQVDLVRPADCPQAIHRIIPNMWIIICVIHTVIPIMWITRFSIHISRHPRVAQVNGVRTTCRHARKVYAIGRRSSVLQKKVRYWSLEWRLGETEKGNTVNGVYAERHGLEFQSPEAFQVRGEGVLGGIHAVGGWWWFGFGR